MSAMRNPRAFFSPLALGAPMPLTEIPFTPSRMIHFFDPSNPKMAAKLPELAQKTDILLGNLEDAIPADRKIDAREGLVKIGREVDFGDTPLWTRVNSLDSPWFLDDVTRLVGEIGNRLELREQAVGVGDVPGAFDLGQHDHVDAVAGARDDLRDVIEEPRAVEAVDARLQRGVAQVDRGGEIGRAHV